MAHAVGEVERRASGHVNGMFRGYNFVECNMAYTADIVFLHDVN